MNRIYLLLNTDGTKVEEFPLYHKDIVKYARFPSADPNSNLFKNFLDIRVKEVYNGNTSPLSLLLTDPQVNVSFSTPKLTGMYWTAIATPVAPPITAPVEITVEEKRAKLLTRLATEADAVVMNVAQAKDIPSFEVQSWTLQFAEATAWGADETVSTPLLNTIADARGIPRDVLKARALEKSKNYQLALAFIIGKRQRYEDSLLAATTIQELESVVFDFDIPFEMLESISI